MRRLFVAVHATQIIIIVYIRSHFLESVCTAQKAALSSCTAADCSASAAEAATYSCISHASVTTTEVTTEKNDDEISAPPSILSPPLPNLSVEILRGFSVYSHQEAQGSVKNRLSHDVNKIAQSILAALQKIRANSPLVTMGRPTFAHRITPFRKPIP